MQRIRMMQWGIASGILLFTNLLLAQEVSSPKSGFSLPAPTTMSDQTFKAKAKQQSEDVSKQINQEAASQVAQITNPSKQRAAQQQDDNANNLSPNTDSTPTSDNQIISNTDVTPTPVTAPPINQPMPTNSNSSNTPSGNNAKSNWQIQY